MADKKDQKTEQKPGKGQATQPKPQGAQKGQKKS